MHALSRVETRALRENTVSYSTYFVGNQSIPNEKVGRNLSTQEAVWRSYSFDSRVPDSPKRGTSIVVESCFRTYSVHTSVTEGRCRRRAWVVFRLLRRIHCRVIVVGTWRRLELSRE